VALRRLAAAEAILLRRLAQARVRVEHALGAYLIRSQDGVEIVMSAGKLVVFVRGCRAGGAGSEGYRVSHEFGSRSEILPRGQIGLDD